MMTCVCVCVCVCVCMRACVCACVRLCVPLCAVLKLANCHWHCRYDRSHCACVEFYKEQVFKSGLVRRGTFIEDT